MKKYSAILFLFFCLASGNVSADDSWPSFQNGGQLGAKKSSDRLPVTWAADKNIRWSEPTLGYGQSSPVFDGEFLYVTSVAGDMKDQFILEAKNMDNGKNMWYWTVKNSSPEKSSTYVSRAAPSPVCDQDGVIAFWEGGNLLAMSKDGDKRWELDLVKKYGPIKARHGLASSLEQDDRYSQREAK